MNQWMRVFDAVSNLAQLAGGFRKPAAPPSDAGAVPPGGGPIAQLETRLAGVVVAALKEAFDRDRARMDLEREHLESERRRAEEALRAELRRQAADRALGRLRLVATMAIGVWIVSAALGVWLPGMHGGVPRALLGAGWACAIAALGCAFAARQRVAAVTEPAFPGVAEAVAPWLLVTGIALSAASLLTAL